MLVLMKLAHLSDLHLGHHTSHTKLESLVEDLLSQAPDILVNTGDITDRGTVAQFRRARDFVNSLGLPFLSVPGNREVAITAVWEWLIPRLAMRRYHGFFGQIDKVVHCVEGSGVLLLGLNSVHPFPSWPGSISRESRHWLKDQAARHPEHVKILFLHHPVLPVIRSSSFWAHSLSDAGEVLNISTQTGINLILQGHKHRSAVMEITFPQRNASVVVSACGAPLMSRWDPTYHMVEVSKDMIRIRPRTFLHDRFVETGVHDFTLNGRPVGGLNRQPGLFPPHLTA
jgi:3',5'-cyclic AMP phosphodiesterase CpdA